MTRLPRLLAASLLCLAAAGQLAQAADYPTRPVKWVVPYPPAGTTDVLARIIAQWLTEKMGQPFVVENKPGAGNNLGIEAVVNAAPDGYTMLLVNPANGINATLYKNLNFNFIRDIAPVAGLVRTPNVMEVTPSFPAKTVAEFIAYCKANPGKINMAVVGQRHLGAPVGRAVQVDDRLRHAARAVQGRRAGADRPDGRPGATCCSTTCRRRSATSRAASCAPWRHLAKDASRRCRSCRRSPRRCPATRRRPGSASACRRARRATSSTRSTPR